MRSTENKLEARPASPDDHSFVYATYLRNRWYDKDNTTTLKKDTWFRLMHDRLERMLKTQEVVVACLSQAPDVILGYKLMDGSTPFTYVKKDWRKPGLGVVGMLEEVKIP